MYNVFTFYIYIEFMLYGSTELNGRSLRLPGSAVAKQKCTSLQTNVMKTKIWTAPPNLVEVEPSIVYSKDSLLGSAGSSLEMSLNLRC
jgi:hypothetical protein